MPKRFVINAVEEMEKGVEIDERKRPRIIERVNGSAFSSKKGRRKSDGSLNGIDIIRASFTLKFKVLIPLISPRLLEKVLWPAGVWLAKPHALR